MPLLFLKKNTQIRSSKNIGRIIQLINPKFNQEYDKDQKHLCSCYNCVIQEQKPHHDQGFSNNNLLLL